MAARSPGRAERFLQRSPYIIPPSKRAGSWVTATSAIAIPKLTKEREIKTMTREQQLELAAAAREAIESDMEKRKTNTAFITNLGQSGPELFITLSNGMTIGVEVLSVRQTRK